MSFCQSSIHSGIQSEERWSRRRRRVQLHSTWIIHLIDIHHFSIYNCRCLQAPRIWWYSNSSLNSVAYRFRSIPISNWIAIAAFCIYWASKTMPVIRFTLHCVRCKTSALLFDNWMMYSMLNSPVKCWNVICNMTITAMTNDTTKTALKYDKWIESCIEWISKLCILTRANTGNLLLANANIVFRAKIAETNVKTKQSFRTLNASR